MIQWEDEALLLGVRRFGEAGLILDVLTQHKGRQSGLVHGGNSRRRRGQLQPGNTLHVSWGGRIEDQLGRFDVAEAICERAANLLEAANALAAIAALTASLRNTLMDGDAQGSALYPASTLLLDMLGDADEPVWAALYVRWELGLLEMLGFGLDLSCCALSGTVEGLTHVSPRTGRAVCGAEAPDYIDRLLPLPSFLTQSDQPAKPEEIGHGFILTGYFLQRRVYEPVHRPPPEERSRLIERLERAGTIRLTRPST